jgi:hypothetical protein
MKISAKCCVAVASSYLQHQRLGIAPGAQFQALGHIAIFRHPALGNLSFALIFFSSVLLT